MTIHALLLRLYCALTPRRLAGGGILLALCAALLDCQPAWARAGGGHSFGGGGGSFGGGGRSSGFSGSGGGSSDGSILLLYYLVRFLVVICIDHPFVGIPVAIGVCYFVYHSFRAGGNRITGGVIRRGQLARRALSQQQIAALLQQKDPDFDAGRFLDRARTAFTIAQNAWCAQDLTPLRPFAGDGIHDRWTIQLAQEREQGFRDRMDELRILASGLADCRVCGETEELTAFFTARCSDYRVRLDDGRPLPDADTSPQEFTEYWTFVRRRGSRSLRDKDGLMEGRCPNCGSPVGINQSAKCTSCGAFLRSGAFDWVLMQITQEEVYAPAGNELAPGVTALLQNDPSFSPQLVEDRAAVAFWRWIAALQAGDLQPLRGTCGVKLGEAIEAKCKTLPRVLYRECAVGSARLVGVLRDEALDHALIELVWSAEAVTLRQGGGQTTGDKMLSRTLFVLDRAVGVQSAGQRSAGSAHCPGCGAPEEADAGGLCRYCGSPLNSQQTGWILTSICANASEAAGRWRERLASQYPAVPTADEAPDGTEPDANAQPAGGFSPSAYAVLAWMVKMATEDQELAPAEKRLLLDAGKARRIPQATVENMIAAALAGTFQPPEPPDQPAAIEWLRGMARLALADGKIMAAELELLQNMAERCGYTDYDLQLLLKKERATLYRQAQDDLRQTRTQQR